jgi:hypothetical protein
LCIKRINNPKIVADKINNILGNPDIEKDNLMRIVEMMNPEFLMTLWNSSVWKNEKSNNITSAMIRMVKNCSKKMLLMFVKLTPTLLTGYNIPQHQFTKE